MTTIWERTATAITTITQPKAANFYQAATGADLPDIFLVYFLVDSLPEQHADDGEKLRSWRMQLTWYSRAGLAGLPDIDTLMLAAGFTRGPQRELPYNQLTRHFGLALEYVYLDG
jgi:hypothetical protein